MPSDASLNGDNIDGKDKSLKKKENGSDRDRGKDICRDYLNNICNRGSRCKFFHPDEHEGKSVNAAEEPYQFCIDYQNQGCHRENCRYVHAFREDVDRYKRTGDVTLGLARALVALSRGDSINGIPLCKEFQGGHCARGAQCRYWHINKDEERRKRFAARGNSGGGGSSASAEIRPFGAYTAGPPSGIRRRGDEYAPPAYDDYGPPSKRGAYAPAPPPIAPGIPAVPPQSRAMVDLERRNAELVAEVDSLKRELQREKERYDDLMALFRATQANQSASIQQQQRPLQMATAPVAAQQQPIQSTIPSLALQQQQPSIQQQWAAAGSAQSYLSNYEWPPTK